MASKSKKKTNSKKTKKTGDNLVLDEIIIWFTLALCILIFISYFGFGGIFGETISAVMMEAFGVMAYITPIILFVGVAFYISNKHNKSSYLKLAASVVLYITLCGTLELMSKAGGALGETVAGMMTPVFGVIGTYVVFIALIIICMVIITGKSALKSVQMQSNKAYDKAKENNRKRQELVKERKTEREEKAETKRRDKKASPLRPAIEDTNIIKRKDKKVEGVSFDTTFSRKSPEITELHDQSETIANPTVIQNSKKESHDFVINRTTFPQQEEPAELPDPFEEKTEPAEETSSRRKKSKASQEELQRETSNVEKAVERDRVKPQKVYKYPPISLLNRGRKATGDSDAHLRKTAAKLEETLGSFGVKVTVTNVSCGPSVTRYELQPEQGVKVSKIVGLADDIKLNLAAPDIRIEAPIPGKAAVGIEVPNKENATVMLRDLLESKEFKENPSKIAFAAGRDIAGQVVVTDIAKMPHLLVAGATGSGKSVCINTLIMSILYKATPEEVKLIMVDPKVVELSVYNGIPHLMIPVVTDPKKAAGALNWAVMEMTKRYQMFAEHQVRDIKGYNAKIASMESDENVNKPQKMCQLVIIVDELADLMMVAPGEVEESICRLAQLARAAGIHLILATQRPSVNVITGLIKANMPSRIAFSVTSGVDSRTIIDMNGAEKLLGKGDMLFYPSGYQKPARVQGAFVSDKEVQDVVDFLKDTNEDVSYSEEIVEHMNSNSTGNTASQLSGNGNDKDAYFVEAGKFIIDKEKASIGMLQRVFKIGFNRAARIMDQLCEAGVVGPEEGTKPRKVLMSMEEFEQYIDEYI